MSFLDDQREDKPTKVLSDGSITEEEILLDLDLKWHEIDGETGRRFDNYRRFVDFYNGDHRGYRQADPGRTNKVWNLCFPTINTFQALVFGEMVKMTAVPDWETNKIEDVQTVDENDQEEQTEYVIEYSRAQFIDKLLAKVFGKQVHKEFLDAEHNASKLGMGVIQWGWDRKKKKPFFASIYPGFTRVGWKNQSFSEISHVFLSVPMEIGAFERQYGFKVEESDIEFSKELPEMNQEVFNEINRQDKVLLTHYYDEKFHIIRVGNRIIPQGKDNKLITKHGYGRVPVSLFLANRTADRPLGASDIRDGWRIQRDINATLSGWFDVSKSDEGTKTIVPGGNQQTMDALAKQGSHIVGSNRDGPQPYILVRSGQQPDLQARLSFLRDAFFQTVGLSQSFTAAPDTSVITQVGINALNFPTLIRLKPRIAQRMAEIEIMVKNVLVMFEKFGGTINGTNLTYKQMVDKHYEVDIEFQESMPRDEAVNTQMELFKLDRRVQSRGQTMQNLGIENPLEEIEQIAFEENNPLYNPEGAREERRMELAENAQEQGQERPEDEVVQEAQAENQALQQGQQVPVNEETMRDNQIHMTIHQPLLQEVQQLAKGAGEGQGEQFQAVVQAIQTHIQEHQTRMAALQGGGGTSASPAAGAGQGAFGGRPPTPTQGAFNPPTAQGSQPPTV